MTNCNKALGFWKIGRNYLHLVGSVSNETYRQGNNFVATWDVDMDEWDSTDAGEEDSIEVFGNQTKWSDFNLVIPLLFNFYHGLELLLKGFICAKNIQIEQSHKLSKLLLDFKDNFQNCELTLYFEKYIEQNKLPNVLSEFCSTSGISIDDYYQALKYPEGTSGSHFQHYPLQYRGQRGSQFFKNLGDDIEKILKESLTLGREIYPNCPNV
jgi:hypothetical protein